jgi:uncharacterized protein
MAMKKNIPALFLFQSLYDSAQSYVPGRNEPRMKVRPVVPVKAYSFNLRGVKLLGKKNE